MKLLISPLTYITAFALCGMGCIVSGVYLLAGIGWATITCGALLIASAALLTRGLNG